jgi:hypothetical protein
VHVLLLGAADAGAPPPAVPLGAHP